MYVEKSYDHNNIVCELLVNEYVRFLITKSSKSRFCLDDVYIELLTEKNRYLVFEDSFNYSAYTEMSNSIDIISKADVGAVEKVIGAPCDKGGLQIWFLKTYENNIELKVIKEYCNRKNRVLYSVDVKTSVLMDWKQKLTEVKETWVV